MTAVLRAGTDSGHSCLPAKLRTRFGVSLEPFTLRPLLAPATAPSRRIRKLLRSNSMYFLCRTAFLLDERLSFARRCCPGVRSEVERGEPHFFSS